MKIILSTRNVSKAEQIKAILQGLPIDLLTLSEAGIKGEAEENGNNLYQNAYIKASFAQSENCFGLADDTGLFIETLNGEPGHKAARWAGPNKSTEEIMQFTLDRLLGVPLEKRTAIFRTVIVLISPGVTSISFRGEVRGKLLLTPRTTCQPNMPYSALFVPDGQDKTWAEMTVEEENAISHRGEAFRQLRSYLEKKLQQ